MLGSATARTLWAATRAAYQSVWPNLDTGAGLACRMQKSLCAWHCCRMMLVPAAGHLAAGGLAAAAAATGDTTADRPVGKFAPIFQLVIHAKSAFRWLSPGIRKGTI